MFEELAILTSFFAWHLVCAFLASLNRHVHNFIRLSDPWEIKKTTDTGTPWSNCKKINGF